MTLLAGGTGFGPILRESKSRVLPLDHPPERSSFDQSVRRRVIRESRASNWGVSLARPWVTGGTRTHNRLGHIQEFNQLNYCHHNQTGTALNETVPAWIKIRLSSSSSPSHSLAATSIYTSTPFEKSPANSLNDIQDRSCNTISSSPSRHRPIAPWTCSIKSRHIYHLLFSIRIYSSVLISGIS